MRRFIGVFGAILCVACGNDSGRGGADGGLSDTGGSAGNTSNAGGSSNSGGKSSSGGTSSNGGATHAGGATSGADASSRGDAASSTGGRHGGTGPDGGVDASAEDGSSKHDASAPDAGSDAGIFEWVNPCPPGAQFPVGTYELEVYDYYQDFETENALGHPDNTADISTMSRLLKEKLTITPMFGTSDWNQLQVTIPPVNVVGSYDAVSAPYVMPIDDDTLYIEWSTSVQGASQNFHLTIHKKSGLVTGYWNTASEEFMAPSNETMAGNGIRVCGEVEDGGTMLSHVPTPAPPSNDVPPGCTRWDWTVGTNPGVMTPSCESTSWYGATIPPGGCINDHSVSCVDNPSGLNALCCP